ncbi:Terminase small subunit [uncultured Caudovirales phage]|uniref:Terminase small subunit n=1 Tax=uncultured Caudovirales phage TaxID=2100421 RepID=A0A6J7WCC5_9CAUD|nr:Terminase small subunit [uncultured Caudovirales phage]
MPRELTLKQQRFVEEYLVDLNATAAYKRAGYVAKGNAAEVNAARLLRNAQVQAAVTAAKAERSERTKVDADWLLLRLVEEAEADVAMLYADDGTLKQVKDWPLIWRKGLVAGLDVEEIRTDGLIVGHVRKLRLSDRIKRLELIGKHVGVQAFRDRVAVDGAMTLTVVTGVPQVGDEQA